MPFPTTDPCPTCTVASISRQHRDNPHRSHIHQWGWTYRAPYSTVCSPCESRSLRPRRTLRQRGPYRDSGAHPDSGARQRGVNRSCRKARGAAAKPQSRRLPAAIPERALRQRRCAATLAPAALAPRSAPPPVFTKRGCAAGARARTGAARLVRRWRSAGRTPLAQRRRGGERGRAGGAAMGERPRGSGAAARR